MADNSALERGLQATLDRLVENRLASLRQEITSELQREIAATVANLSGTGSRAVGPSSSETLVELDRCVSAILQPVGQSEIMTAYLQAAAGFCGRCALFVRRGDHFGFWRAEGFRGDALAGLRSVSASTSEPGIFKEVSDRHQAYSCTRSPEVIPSGLNAVLGDSADLALYLFPVVVQARVVAALYADAGSVAGSVEPAALDILSKVAGLSLETAGSRGLAVNADAQSTATVAQAPIQVTPEIAEPPTAEFESTAVPSRGSQAPPQGSFAASIPSGVAASPGLAPIPDIDMLSEEDRESHRRAHRFARVAVQDLLSYHKAKIEQGRKDRNLYLLLKDDIEKTRENYKKRFGNTAASSFDYLHYELVVKLAGNDPATLGAQYPGPSQ